MTNVVKEKRIINRGIAKHKKTGKYLVETEGAWTRAKKIGWSASMLDATPVLLAPSSLNGELEFLVITVREEVIDGKDIVGPGRLQPRLRNQKDKPFRDWVESLSADHWAKYDLSACRLGWDAALNYIANSPTTTTEVKKDDDEKTE